MLQLVNSVEKKCKLTEAWSTSLDPKWDAFYWADHSITWTLNYLYQLQQIRTKLTECKQPPSIYVQPLRHPLHFMQQELLWAHWYLTTPQGGEKLLLQHRKPATTAEIELTSPLRSISCLNHKVTLAYQNGKLVFLVAVFQSAEARANVKNKVPPDCVFRQVRNLIFYVCLDNVQHSKTDWSLEKFQNALLDCPPKQSMQKYMAGWCIVIASFSQVL